jgi:hypothetical protein
MRPFRAPTCPIVARGPADDASGTCRRAGRRSRAFRRATGLVVAEMEQLSRALLDFGSIIDQRNTTGGWSSSPLTAPSIQHARWRGYGVDHRDLRAA